MRPGKTARILKESSLHRLNSMVLSALVLTFLGTGSALARDGEVPLPIKLPKPSFAGTPKDAPPGTTVEKPTGKPRPVPLVPKGTVNLALNKKVTASKAPFFGTLDLITDGDKEAKEGTTVELKPGLQWVQIDLGAAERLLYVLVWHFHVEPVVFHGVVVQVSDDPNFVNGVTTIFNNDQDNSDGLGIGRDREYFETNEGKLID